MRDAPRVRVGCGKWLARGLLPCLVASCKVLPPPPVMAPHADAAADPIGATTAMLVVGLAGELLGGGGWGLALRIEHQATDLTAAGFELTGGRGDHAIYADGTRFEHWLVAGRAYGRTSTSRAGNIALLYGAGLSLQATGLVTATLHAGGIASYPDGHAVPLGAFGFALAVPLRAGRAYGDVPLPALMFGEAEPRPPGFHDLPPARPQTAVPKTEIYLALDLGVMARLGDTLNRISLDLGSAFAMRADTPVFSLSLADAQRF